jgi:hypothetical protein
MITHLERTRRPGLVMARPWVHATRAGLPLGQQHSDTTERPGWCDEVASPYCKALDTLAHAVHRGESLNTVLEAAFAALRAEVTLLRAERYPDHECIVELEEAIARVAPEAIGSRSN